MGSPEGDKKDQMEECEVRVLIASDPSLQL